MSSGKISFIKYNKNSISKNVVRNISSNQTGISHKKTNISSYIDSESKNISKKISKKLLFKKNNENKFNKIFLIKEKILLNLTSKLNEKQKKDEYESKFLNYELGTSDKLSLSLISNLNENNKNDEIYEKEYEKPLKEIEKNIK